MKQKFNLKESEFKSCKDELENAIKLCETAYLKIKNLEDDKLQLGHNIRVLVERRDTFAQNWMHHYSHWINIAYKNQKEQLLIEEGAIISRHYMLKSAIKSLKKNVI